MAVYAAGLLAQSRLGMDIEIDGLLSDIGKVWTTLGAKGRKLTGGSDPDVKDLLLWALVVGGVTSQFLSGVWDDVVKVAGLLEETPGTLLTVDEHVDVVAIRSIYARCRAGVSA